MIPFSCRPAASISANARACAYPRSVSGFINNAIALLIYASVVSTTCGLTAFHEFHASSAPRVTTGTRVQIHIDVRQHRMRVGITHTLNALVAIDQTAAAPCAKHRLIDNFFRDFIEDGFDRRQVFRVYFFVTSEDPEYDLARLCRWLSLAL